MNLLPPSGGPAAEAPLPRTVRSRDNPLLVQLRKQARDPAAYRRTGQVWLDGEHLVAALVARGGRPEQVVAAESAWGEAALQGVFGAARAVTLLPDALMDSVSALDSPVRLGALVALPASLALAADCATVVLDRLQDAGNVGSILRSAAALGVRQVLALKGTAALWSPKVMRAAQGAHFGLNLHEGLGAEDLSALQMPLVGTCLEADVLLPMADLPEPCAWVLGHEGRGVDPELLARCAMTVRIPQPGGEESLNVAAAAAICLYESARRRLNAP